jgi:hypothetical protein
LARIACDMCGSDDLDIAHVETTGASPFGSARTEKLGLVVGHELMPNFSLHLFVADSDRDPDWSWHGALGDAFVESQAPRTQQLLGWLTRLPTSLDEYYQPPEKRLYRSGQV